MNLNVLDLDYDGIGDAVLYTWLIHSARAAGNTAVRVNMRRHVEIAHMFGVTPDMATHEPGDRYFLEGKGGNSPQTGAEIKEADTMSRFRSWATHLGLGDIQPVRPPYIEPAPAGEWAEKTWNDRDAATGKNLRVLVFPETYWQSRQWPVGYFKDLAAMLDRDGCNVVTMLPSAKNASGFPYFLYGHSLYHGAAMMARADIVIGVDSGPAHMAGTIGTPTIAVCGPTKPEVVFDHLPGVKCLTAGRDAVPCVGCHFRADHGFRAACSDGCRALLMLPPEDVYLKVRRHLETLAEEVDIAA